MGRVVRIGAGVMGVLLVVVTAGLWVRRATTEPEYGMVFEQKDYLTSSKIVVYFPTLNYTRQVLSIDGSLFHGSLVTPNRSIILIGKARDSEISDVFWLDLDTLERKYILSEPVGELPAVSLSPDEKWLSYTEYPEDDINSCHVLNLQTRATTHFADLLQESQNTYCAGFSEDSQWLWIKVSVDGGLPSGESIYRVGLMNHLVENYSGRFGDVNVFHWLPDQPKIVGAKSEKDSQIRRLYWSDPTNIQWQPIINASPAELSTGYYREDLRNWLPEDNLMIVSVILDSNSERTVAVPLTGGPPRWTVDNLRYLWFQSHSKWLFFQDDNRLYRMRPDGTDFALIAELPSNREIRWVQLIEDEHGTEWLYLETSALQTGKDIIWRMHIDGSQLEPILIDKDTLRIVRWTPDHKWLLVSTTIEDGSGRLYEARLDGSDRHLVWPDLASRFLDWSLSPTKPSQPVPLLLIGIGLIGSSVFGKRPYHLTRQRHRLTA